MITLARDILSFSFYPPFLRAGAETLRLTFLLLKTKAPCLSTGGFSRCLGWAAPLIPQGSGPSPVQTRGVFTPSSKMRGVFPSHFIPPDGVEAADQAAGIF